MFSFATAIVPLIFPVGWGIGYAVTTGMKKVCDHFFPGKDCNEENNQAEEDDLFWKGFPSSSKEQTDPAGEVCLKMTVHRECETTVAEKSNPAGEDLSAADLAAKAVEEVTAKALASLVPSLQKSPLKGTFTGSFEIQSSPDGELCISDENRVALLSRKPPLNVKISVAVEVSCSPGDNSAASVGLDLPDVGRTSVGQGQAEENFFKFSDELHNSWVNAAFQSILNLSVTKRCLAQERVFFGGIVHPLLWKSHGFSCLSARQTF
ncbi:PREDICTED: uncharacterized protein LOC106915052 isoform X2 [Poecilia mexicana]|uniref:uncharacterized protein LOC106915052 isoform X2 n=1 Tax=Poecilia mexicana TaxID=48701 RepID=UPI00072E221B|nr:PREDICTED: uncharacterized protein LOC106915052 isoform X2 [Poecilia mexicana]